MSRLRREMNVRHLT